MTNAPAGWYPQPDGTQRYWDGNAWDDRHPLAPNTSGSPGRPVPIQDRPTNPGATPTPATPGMLSARRPAFIVPLVILTLLVGVLTFGLAYGLNRDGAQDGAVTQSSASSSVAIPAPTLDPSVGPTQAAADYGSFAEQTYAGHGDSVINLPAQARAGLVTAEHDGAQNFIIVGLTADNDNTYDFLVNVIGKYQGTTAYGLVDSGERAARLKVTADGDWSITLAPMSTAPQLGEKASGTGDAVFWMDGAARDWQIRHPGKGSFSVTQSGPDGQDTVVSATDAYRGMVPLVGGRRVLSVQSEGPWSIAVS